MAKEYIAKEESVQNVLTAVNNLSFSGGGFKVRLKNVTNAVVTNGNLKNYIKWKDPKDAVIDGAIFAKWAGTKVVRKEGFAPTNPNDGVVVLDNKERDAYAITPYEDTELTPDTDYYYAFFPYSDTGVYTLVDSPEAHTTTRADKAPATMTVDNAEVVGYAALEGYDYLKFPQTVNVTSNSDGEIVAISNDLDIATVSVDGMKVIITPIGEGETTVVISQYEGTEFTSPKDATVKVQATIYERGIYENLEWVSWDFVQAMIKAGLAQTFWDTGDLIPIKLNGDLKGASTAIAKSFSDKCVYATVLGFDHNSSLESESKHSMHFIVGRDPQTLKSIALQGFQMNTTDVNGGGWRNSQMRTVICSSFYECLPDDLKAVISTVTKYSDNAGNGGANTPSSDMSATKDKIFLLSEYEIHGAKSYANSNEQYYQQQYEYYANGNSKIYYNAEAINTAVVWWCRSAFATNGTHFCAVSGGGAPSYGGASGAHGFAPGFAIIADS